MPSNITGNQLASIRMMSESGTTRIPADSNMGNLYRPQAEGWPGGRVATLETLFDFFINNVPDPDIALAQDPNFDEKLRQQPDVHACMRIRELTVASMPWRIEPSEHKNINRDAAQMLADYVEDIFQELPDVSDLFKQMQNAVLMGGQGHEFVWARGGPGGLQSERPVEFYPIHKSRFVFDRLGNMSILTRNQPVWGAYVAPAMGRFKDWYPFPSPRGKFMYHKYMAEGGPWYRTASEGYLYWGRGEDTHLYLPVVFDQFVLRFRMKWLEKHGMPLTVVYYPDNDQFRSQIIQIANSIRGEGIVLLPKPSTGEPGSENTWYKIEQMEPSSAGQDAFANFSESWTKPNVSKILLGGANVMELGDVGAYAATVDQRDAGPNIIFRWDANKVSQTINQQLIPAIMQRLDSRIPHKYFPKLRIMPKTYQNRQVDLEVLQTVSSMGVPVREQDVYDAAAIDRPKDNEPTLKPPQQPMGGMPGEPGMEGENIEDDAQFPPEKGQPGMQQPGGLPKRNGQAPVSGKGTAANRLGLPGKRR